MHTRRQTSERNYYPWDNAQPNLPHIWGCFTCNKLFCPAGKVLFDLQFFFFPLQLKTLLLLLGHEFKFHPGWEWLNTSISNRIYLVNNRTAITVHFFGDTCLWLSCILQVLSLYSLCASPKGYLRDMTPMSLGESPAGAELIPKQGNVPQMGQSLLPGSSHALKSFLWERQLGPIQSNPTLRRQTQAEKFLWAALSQDQKPTEIQTHPYYLALASWATEPEQELRILSSASYSYSVT